MHAKFEQIQSLVAKVPFRFEKKTLAIIAVAWFALGAGLSYYRYSSLLTHLGSYMELQKGLAVDILRAYKVFGVFSFRDMPGIGAGMGGRQSLGILNEIEAEENALYEKIDGSAFKLFLAKPVLECVNRLHAVREREFRALRRTIANDRFVNLKEFFGAVDSIEHKRAIDCYLSHITQYKAKPSETAKAPESAPVAPAPAAAPEKLPLPDVGKLTREATAGDSNSQLELAVYYEGRLYQNTPDLDMAHRWFFAAAKQDNYLAQLALARLALKAQRAIVRNDFVRPTSGTSRSEAEESIIDAIAWYEIAKLGAKKNGAQISSPAAESEFIEKFKPTAAQKEDGQRQAIEWRNMYLNGGGSAASSMQSAAVVEPAASPVTQAPAPVASLTPSDLVSAMIKAAADDQWAQLAAPKSSLDSLPKPERRDRKVAREKNTAGLEALKKSDFAAAIDRFTEGKNADPSDIELVNNLGYALMMAGKLSEAKAALIDTLTIDSSRGAAWSNFGQLFAKSGDESSAVASFKLTYYFSKAPEKTIEFYRKLAETDSDERVKAAAAKAVPSFANIQPTVASLRYQYQKILDALPPGPAGIGAPTQKVVEVLASPVSADDWAFIRELEADLGQCSTGSACARETEITQARDKRKARGLRAPS